MQLPFTVEQFFGVFRDYNEAVWPAQLFLFGLALAALVVALVPRKWSGFVVSLILALLWAWLAVAYRFLFFSRINPIAYVFGSVSLAGALVPGWQGMIRCHLRFNGSVTFAQYPECCSSCSHSCSTRSGPGLQGTVTEQCRLLSSLPDDNIYSWRTGVLDHTVSSKPRPRRTPRQVDFYAAVEVAA
jgi:hypothetical protein